MFQSIHCLGMSNRKYCFIINPISGGKKKTQLVEDIESFCTSHGLEYNLAYTERKGHASLLAKESDADIIVAVGGDGTVNDVAAALVGSDKVMGIIPCGSGNGLGRHLGISNSNALDTLINGTVIKADCGELNAHFFCCTCGTGLDALIGARFAKKSRRGFLSYVESSLETWNSFKPESYEIDIDGEKLSIMATMITVGNANQWGNNAFITPHASICDGYLDVAVVPSLNTLEMPLFLDFLMTKRLHKTHFAKYYRGKQIKISRKQVEDVHYDGEPDVLGQQLNISVHQGAIKMLVPMKMVNKV